MNIYVYLASYTIKREDIQILGCDNSIGGFHKNFVTFQEQKLPDCVWAQ